MILTGLLCVGWAVIASNRYNMAKTEETKIAKLESDLEAANKAVADLRAEIDGSFADSEESPVKWSNCGLSGQLRHVRALQNGDVFLNCQAVEAKVDEEAKKSSVMFRVDQSYANLASFRNNSVVYIFDSGKPYSASAESDSEGDDASAPVQSDDENEGTAVAQAAVQNPYVFLGAYKVEKSDSGSRQVTLRSIGFASDDELQRLTAFGRSGNSLVACVNLLPVDSPNDLALFVKEFETSNPALYQSLGASARALMSKATADDELIKTVLSEDKAKTFEDFAGSMFDSTSLFVKNFADFAAGKVDNIGDRRSAIDLQGLLERQWTTRDKTNLLIARKTDALRNMKSAAAQLFVLMGEKPCEGLEDGNADKGVKTFDELVADAEQFEGWDEIFADAKAKKSVPSYFERYEEVYKDLVKTTADVELVEKLLADAKDNNDRCQVAIDKLIAENAKTASKIAEAQYAVAEKIERERSSVAGEPAAYEGI